MTTWTAHLWDCAQPTRGGRCDCGADLDAVELTQLEEDELYLDRERRQQEQEDEI